jgi:copper chaperone
MSATARMVFAVTGMHCASCGLLIDDVLEELPGVIRSHTDVRAQRTTVELNAGQVRVGQVIAAITAEGYQARLLDP